MSSVCTPPAPVVVEKMGVHVVALAEVWISKARPNAASQRSTTRQTDTAPPRSTCIHCGSLNALDHRVPLLPSTALAAGVPAFSTEEAVAGRPCATFVVPQTGVPVSPNTWNSQSEYPYWVARWVP